MLNFQLARNDCTRDLGKKIIISLALVSGLSVSFLGGVNTQRANLQLSFGQPANAAPKPKIRIPNWLINFFKGAGEEAVTQAGQIAVGSVIENLINNSSTSSAIPTPNNNNVNYVGSFCASRNGAVFFASPSLGWMSFHPQKGWFTIERPNIPVICYTNVFANPAQQLFLSPVPRYFGYLPTRGWVQL